MNKPPTTSNAPDENAGDAALDSLLDSSADSPVAATEKLMQDAPLSAPESASDLALDEPSAIGKLEAATQGLLMPSESDEPFRTVYWPLEKAEIKPSEVALYLTENADASVETRGVAAFFENAASVEDWMDDEEKATAQRFADLVEIVNSQLDKPCVYLIGQRERTAAVIGKVAGGFAGVVTFVVET